jgi:uncharacterized protein (DUF697 family)
MTRKQLPKVITHWNDDLREFAADAAADEEFVAPQAASLRAVKAKAQTEAAITPLPIARAPVSAASTGAEPQAVRRAHLARKIVDRHRLYAAMGGLFPLPIANVAGVTAIIVRMVKALSDLYEVPFERDRTRSFVIGLMGGAVPTGLAAATASTLVFVIPGSGFVGLAVSSITAASFTRGIGLFFVERFENKTMSLGGTQAAQA